MSNKYSIDSIKLYITEKCILDCDYCFVRNKKDDEMDIKIAKIAIEKLIQSDGFYKSIYILWWEPFLKLDLIKDIINISEQINNKSNKKLNIIISTSGFIKLPWDYINYLNENNIVISFSIDWLKKYHDRHRYLLNKWTTYDNIIVNMDSFIYYNKNNIYGVLTIYPDLDILNDLFKSFINLIYNYNFNSIHISYVNWVKWSEEYQIKYLIGIEKVLNYIFYMYKKWEYIFLTSFSRFLVSDEISINRNNCFLKMLEIHTNWDIWHSMWSHFFFDDNRHIDCNIENIDDLISNCSNNISCSCNKYKDFFLGENIINIRLNLIFKKYEKLFWEDYKKYIIDNNKFI